MSECDFGGGNSLHNVFGGGVIAVSDAVTGTLLQGYSRTEGLALVSAAVLEVEKGVQYLYAAQANGTIVKVSRAGMFMN